MTHHINHFRSIAGAGLMLIALSLAACSGSMNSNPVADTPQAPPAPVYDQITVSFDILQIVADCDPANDPGEFTYSFTVDTAGGDGHYYRIGQFQSQIESLNTGQSAKHPFSVTFPLKRDSISRFAVTFIIAELDDDGYTTDLFYDTTMIHAFRNDSGQAAWADNWDPQTRTGSAVFSIVKRSRPTIIFNIQSDDGCAVNLRYLISAKEETR
jgi:hypothetical protein